MAGRMLMISTLAAVALTILPARVADAPARQASAAVPATAVAAVSAGLGADDPAYAAQGRTLRNARHGLVARFGAAGARLRLGGREYAMTLAGAAPAPPRIRGNRAEYRR